MAVAACACVEEPGVARTRAAIFGGEPAPSFDTVVNAGRECSAVLVHPQLIVLAAHCGLGARVIELGDGRIATTQGCVTVASPQLGSRDLAYCALDEPVALAAIVPPAYGCDIDAIVPGMDVVMVGFGVTGDDAGASAGTRRQASATLIERGDELVVQRHGAGTCSGDSGGGAFVQIDGAWRLAGVLSSGDTEACADGPSYFTPLWPFVPAIEETTGLEITPPSTCGSTATPRAPAHCSAAPIASRAHGGAWLMFAVLCYAAAWQRMSCRRANEGRSISLVSTTVASTPGCTKRPADASATPC